MSRITPSRVGKHLPDASQDVGKHILRRLRLNADAAEQGADYASMFCFRHWCLYEGDYGFRKNRRGLGSAVLGFGASGETPSKPQAAKVLRYAFEIAETGFDPAQISDYYSRTATENMFDALYRYDYLARPAKVIPNVADGMPVITDDFRNYTIKVKPGIYFADDPAFGGKKRELTAQDFVYTFKRIFDPKTKAQIYPDLEEVKLLGMDALRRAAEKPGASFNYDTDVEGLRALDRYTIQFKMLESKPRFHLPADGVQRPRRGGA